MKVQPSTQQVSVEVIHKALLLQVLSPGRGQQIKGDFAAAAKIGEVNLQTNSSAKLAGQHFVGSDCPPSCMLLCCTTTTTILPQMADT